jgi:tRNA modification GTPase
VELCLASGARLAEPGEFTMRAFLNGRLDLTQAEAVRDLIDSQTLFQAKVAAQQLEGSLSKRLKPIKQKLVELIALLEAGIDFAEDDISIAPDATILEHIAELRGPLEQLAASFAYGTLVHEGLTLAIVGRPNVGKSSLLNQLLGHDRAIVSPWAGTTRDTIEETANIRGLPVVFIDTAGLREAGDGLEQEGIRRAGQTLARAELVLHVLDRSAPLTEADRRHLTELQNRKRVVICNKSDQPNRLELPDEVNAPVVDVSCLTGAGLDRLKDVIRDAVWAGGVGAEMSQVTINSRHQDALRRAREAARRAVDALLADATLELVAMDLRIAVNAAGEIVGKTTTEDLLDTIFGQFCIGK